MSGGTKYVPFGPEEILPQDAQERYASWIGYQYNETGVTSNEQLDDELAAGYITQEQYALIKNGEEVPHEEL